MRASDLAILLAVIGFVIACWVALAWAFGFDPGRAALFACLWGATCLWIIWRIAHKPLPDEDGPTWRTGR